MIIIVQAVFILLALVLVVDTFYPLGLPWGRRAFPLSLFWLVLELLALAVIYWLVTVLFLGAPASIR
jgi:hypothetical protein